MVWVNFLAPIDEYTNVPFRILCQKYGAEATCIPLVNSTAVARGKFLFDVNEDEKNLGVQLVGDDPVDIGKSTQILNKISSFKWFNLNCGCPSLRTRESGGGSALLDRPEIIVESIKEMKKNTDKFVSVKIRLTGTAQETIELCKKIQTANVDFIIIHGRTAKQGYSGKCNWDTIKKIKEHIDVPVVGNGDINSIEDGNKLVKNKYCDSFMIGRAAMTNPLIFAGKQHCDYDSKILLLQEYLELYQRYVGNPEISDLKLKAVNFISGVPNASQLRNRICRAKTTNEISSILDLK
ncbi:MAG: tRNA-dihydrouridine synthase family protein [Candidatus Micrarchaeota archaeon]